MPDPHWENLKEIFHHALALAPHERPAYLERASGGDLSLRQAVESLIKSHEEENNFVDAPAYQAAAEMLIDANEFRTGQLVAHYRILSLLGQGGMGTVYLAEDTKLNRKVSLKFLSTNLTQDHERLRRFEQEARAISALNHPNTLTIHEINETDSRRFIATEYVEGQTLRDRLRSPMDLDEALEIAIQVSSALVAAHHLDIVHRDIKPENIMIRHDGLVKVLDFGLAKISVPQRARAIDREAKTLVRANTAPGVVLGTVAYMSPEQARGETVDERSDIWSLGVVLYEMIAGCSPFKGVTSDEVMSGILSKEPAHPLARYARLVPERLEEIVEKAITKNRDERYQTSKDLLIDLKRLKQSLELKAGIERTSSPDRLPAPSSAQWSKDAKTLPIAAATHSLHPNSSAEYIATEIKRHKVLLFGLLALLILGVSLVLYKYKTSAAPTRNRFASQQNLKLAKLTSSGRVRDVTISPDGRYAAYSVTENGKDSLRLRQTATDSDVEILAPVESALTNLGFTRDGNYLYYVYGGFEGTLFQIPALGGPPRRIAGKVSGGAAVSPDGNTIAYTHYDGETIYTLSLANLDGTNQRTLYTSVPPSWFAGSLIPAWSPDGKTIALGINITENDKQLLRLFGISVADGSQRQLSDRNWDDIFGVEWLSNGNLIVSGSEYSNAQTLPNQLWLIASPNVEPQRITNDLNDYYGVRATANGDSLITLQHQKVANLWMTLNNDAAGSAQIGPAAGISGLRWTPSGKFIFVSDRNIWTMNADGSGKQQLTNDQSGKSLPSMTPDGRYIIYQLSRDNILHIWRMDADGNNQKQLTFGYQQWSPGISPDGQWIFYIDSTEKEFSTIWKVPIEGGTPTQVSTTKAFQSYLSPTGSLLAFELPDNSGEKKRIGLMSTSDGKLFKTIILPRTTGLAPVRWTPDGRAIAFTNLRDNGVNIWTIAVDGNGEAKPLTNFKTESIFDFSWSADGRQLATIRGSSIRDAVLITETR
jgi:serine/threonine protein kinase